MTRENVRDLRTDDPTARGRVADLGEAECLRLLAGEPVGRVVWAGREGPSVVPVNFTLDDGRVRIRTAAYSALARECEDSLVAFEVDAYDAETRSGWSVVVRGRARLDVVRPGEPAPDAWPVGAKAVLLTVEPESVTGRRLSPAGA